MCMCVYGRVTTKFCATCVQWMIVPIDLLHSAHLIAHLITLNMLTQTRLHNTHTHIPPHSGKSIGHVCWLCQSTKPGVQEISEERVPILTDGGR